jgi:thioredoxin reductase
MSPVEDELPVAVIGAGPYGLATAAHLRARGVPLRIIGRVLSSWRDNMPAGMVLKSTPWATTISAPDPGYTLQDFCDLRGIERLETETQVVPVETFVDYGLWYAEKLVSEVEDDTVAGVERRVDGTWAVTLASGETFDASAVVVASGLSGYAHMPTELTTAGDADLGSKISHSADHDDLGIFAGREVVVVGAGQSALESAALLREAGASVRLLVRGRGIGFGAAPTLGFHWRPEAPVGRAWSLYALCRWPHAVRFLPERVRLELVRRVLGPKGAWWLRERVDGKVPVLDQRQIVSTQTDGSRVSVTVRNSEGSAEVVEADHILACTGYRVNPPALDFLPRDLVDGLRLAGPFPELDATFQSSVPGLYFTGLAAAGTFGPLLRFVCGTWFAAPTVAEAVASRVGHAGRRPLAGGSGLGARRARAR